MSNNKILYSFMPDYLKTPVIERDIRKIWIPYVEQLINDRDNTSVINLKNAINSELSLFNSVIEKFNKEKHQNT